MKHIAITAALGVLLGTAPVLAQHGHHGQSAVGSVAFANSCTPEVQADLLRGIAMVHSFWYSAGEQTLRQVLARDPGCGIAAWGIATVLMDNPLAGVGTLPRNAERAQQVVAEARRIGARTQRERDYIEAAAAYYDNWAATSETNRQIARARAYEALAAKYPDDDEAQIFSALYIAGTQSQSDQTYAAYARAAEILDAQLAKHPEHPGVAHYLIHAFDAPPIAAKGLAAARRYASLAPDSPHALHMPSHIFTRVGAWEDSASANERAATVALKNGDLADAYHASDYLVYAFLQLGRDQEARAVMERIFQHKSDQPPFPFAFAAAAMPVRGPVERGDWQKAAQLAIPAGGPPFTQAMALYARGIGAARSGDAAGAEQAAAALAERHKALAAAGNTYWARETEIQHRAVAGLAAYAAGRRDDGLRMLREAADLEDRNEKHIVTPGRIMPARELLADMLLEAGQPAEALKEFEASQVREPHRYRGYWGAGRAAEAAGDAARAKDHYAKLAAMTQQADSPLPEVQHAKAFLAR